uniref:Uncharacterized protein n=1 Tax=Bracon brevicornis TaxID=1563983 RepID=A0A6V7LFY8_9HYME
MLLVSLLVVSTLISLSKSTPYRRRDTDEILIDIPYIKGGSWDPAEYYGYSLQNEQVMNAHHTHSLKYDYTFSPLRGFGILIQMKRGN